MKIVPSDDAWQTQSHPVIRTHPESGREALWLNPVYTLAFDDMEPSESAELLGAFIRAHAAIRIHLQTSMGRSYVGHVG
jgi:taurine dioxygenase